ncbi:MAG: hypothetical protein DWQ44_01195 [Bacteroidetes bacterium]|nr:MAG: hypothetical protein DWQ33_00660 [Bacteroidota bacterium]REK04967.1 MAG: hypothetical protein DWQ39_07060 [Bacteroidota bacterium]REK36529.1 MAG: hypothetical protein DWQ44_01195 [Bacteroidota bacterium]REK50895.1 MAG: hypothetical protein DWQ48_02055 [Bacteroidota bacterium]
MLWKGRRKSSNIEDRRGGSRRSLAGGGLGIIIVLVIALLLGKDPLTLLQQTDTGTILNSGEQYQAGEDSELSEFVSVVLADNEDVWNEIFSQAGMNYREPVLVIYRNVVHSACGSASSAVGPFYCPADMKIYIDLSFYDELKNRFSAPGDFAMTYVVAHEVGHHVQNLLGISDKVHAMRSRLSETEYNELSVRLELQADFFAGVFAHHAHRVKNILEEGDIEEALNAANAIGDDNLQKKSQGYVVPDAFTHGTSEQRMRWFSKGFHSGRLEEGDTFSANSL